MKRERRTFRSRFISWGVGGLNPRPQEGVAATDKAAGSSPHPLDHSSWGSRRATRPGVQIPRYLAGYRRPRATHEAFADSEARPEKPARHTELDNSNGNVDLDAVWQSTRCRHDS